MDKATFFKELKEVLEIEDIELSEQTDLKNIDDFAFDGVDNAQVKDWWHPELLGDYTKYQVRVEECNCHKEMWVDKDRKEVYFRVAFH